MKSSELKDETKQSFKVGAVIKYCKILIKEKNIVDLMDKLDNFIVKNTDGVFIRNHVINVLFEEIFVYDENDKFVLELVNKYKEYLDNDEKKKKKLDFL